MQARLATERDADLLRHWRNDPVTRAWSRNPAPVSEADHLTWLRESLDSPDRLLLIVESPECPLGTTRFDRGESGWEVSITVAPEHRGRGLSQQILALGEAELRARHPVGVLLACVHRDNQASVTLFRNAGYLPRAEQPEERPFRWLAKRLP